MKLYKTGLFLFVLLVIMSCSPKMELYNPTNGNYRTELDDIITAPVILISDTQENEFLAEPLKMQGEGADRVVTEVAKRTVQQDLFIKDVFLTILKKHEDKPIIHLGDFLNISCKTEFEQVEKVLKQAKSPWVLAIGNHDGYFMGNYSKKAEGKNTVLNLWKSACDHGRKYDNPEKNRFDKDELIEAYLNLLADEQQLPKLKEKIMKNKQKEKPKGKPFELDNKELDHPFYYKIACYIMGKGTDRIGDNFFGSYLLQQVILPKSTNSKLSSPVHLIILDTSQYDKPFSFMALKPAGKKGQILENQIVNYAGGNKFKKDHRYKEYSQWNILMKWIDDNHKKGIKTLLAGHHPIKEMQNDFLKKLVKLRKEDKILNLYLSGHTHSGGFYQSVDKNFYELNIGSLNDFPIHYRNLSIIKKSPELFGVYSEYFPLKISSVNDVLGISCKCEWFPETDQPHSVYVQEGKKGKISEYLKRWKPHHEKLLASLHIYRDIMEFFPKSTISKNSISFRLREDDTIKQCFQEYIEEGNKIKKVVFTPTDQTEEQISRCIDCCIEKMEKKNTIKDFSTVNIIRFISALSEYEPDNQKEYTAYKICQALWASEEEAKLEHSRSVLEKNTENNRCIDIFYLK
jgi:3',5'-cyclic AMP phosphodiesterase CpdA